MLLNEKDILRFWSKIDRQKPDDCWLWTDASTLTTGYGLFTLATGKSGGKKVVASRIACSLEHGLPPHPKAKALHSCDNPPCCNPAHLRWGTQKDNVRDALERNRASKPPMNFPGRHTGKMPKGEALWNNSLTENDAREIFKLHMSHHNVSQIAEVIGKPKHVIADVCRGRSWRHLSDIPSLEDLKRGGVRRGFNQFS